MAGENTVYIDITADTKNFEKKLNESIKTARDTGKKLDSELIIKMDLNIAEMQLKLQNAKNIMKKAKADGDETMQIKANIDINNLSRNLTEAKRQMNNYLNTGETGLSRLQIKFNQVTDEIKKSRDELLKMGKSTNGLDNLIKKADDLQSEFKQGTITQKQYEKSLIDIQDQANQTGNKIGKMGNSFGFLGGLSNLLPTIGFATLATSIGQASAEAETARVRIENLTGSIDTANQVIEGAKQFAKDSPFAFPEVIEGEAKLMSIAGVVRTDLIPTMTALGDIASSQGKPILQAVEAFNDAITGEFERLKEFGITAKQSGDKVAFTFQGQTKEVDKTKEAIGNYLKEISKMPGVAGSMEKQSQTLNGKMSAFGDTLKNIGTYIGDIFSPYLKTLITWLTSLEDVFIGTVKGMQAVGAIAFYGIVSGFLNIQKAGIQAMGGIGIVIQKGIEYFKLFAENGGILVDNLGIIWGNLPIVIKGALNDGIKLIEDFLNSASDGVNNFAKKLGFKGDLVDKISLGRFEAKGPIGNTKQFKTNIDESGINATTQTIQKQIDKIDDLKNSYKESTNDFLKELVKKNTNTNNNILGTDPKNPDPKDPKNPKDKTKQAKDETKALNGELKTQLDQQNKYAEYLDDLEKKKQDKLKDRLKNVNEYYKEGSDIVKKQVDKAKDNIDSYIDKIKDLQDEIGKLNEDLTNLETDKITNLGDRNNEIIQKQIDLQKELNDLKNSGVDIGRAESIGLDTLNQIGTGDIGGNKVEDLIKVAEIQKELNDLAKEKLLISQNLTEDQIKEAQRVGGLSPTEKYLEEFAIEKKKIEDQITNNNEKIKALESQKASEEEILKVFDEKQKTLDENYKNKKLEIEKQITDDLILQNTTRIDSLKTVELQALATAEALRNAGINLNTDITGTGVNTAGIGSTNGSSSNTTNTATTVINQTFHQNINSAVDVNKVNKIVLDSMSANAKGMSSLKV